MEKTAGDMLIPSPSGVGSVWRDRVHHMNGRVYARDPDTGEMTPIAEIEQFDFRAAYFAATGDYEPERTPDNEGGPGGRDWTWLVLSACWILALGFIAWEIATVWF